MGNRTGEHGESETFFGFAIAEEAALSAALRQCVGADCCMLCLACTVVLAGYPSLDHARPKTEVMAKEARRNRHHFLARHLLQHFAAADGLLCVYDRKQAWAARRDLPERLAMEKYLYAPEMAGEPGDDLKDDSVERWLADEIDGPAFSPINALAGGAALQDLSDDALHAIADFIALLDLRTPSIRDLLLPVFEQGVAQRIRDDKQTERELRQQGVRVTRSNIRKAMRGKGAKMAAALAKPGWLHYLKDTRQIARINVKARRWSIVQASGSCEFITSDLGMAKSLLGPLQPVSWEPGTIIGRAHWIVPISPQRAIAITPKNAPDPVASEALVEATNQQLILDARRYVYSCTSIDAALLANAPAPEGASGTPPVV